MTPQEEIDILTQQSALVENLLTTDGKSVTATVTQVGLQTLARWHRQAPDQEVKAADMLAEPTAMAERLAFIRSLTPASQFAVLEKGGELNDPLFARYYAAQTSALRAAGIDPLVVEIRARAIAMLAEKGITDKELSGGPSASTSSPKADTPSRPF